MASRKKHQHTFILLDWCRWGYIHWLLYWKMLWSTHSAIYWWLGTDNCRRSCPVERPHWTLKWMCDSRKNLHSCQICTPSLMNLCFCYNMLLTASKCAVNHIKNAGQEECVVSGGLSWLTSGLFVPAENCLNTTANGNLSVEQVHPFMAI